MTHTVTHKNARFRLAHGSLKLQYLLGKGCWPKDPKKPFFNPFDTQSDTRRRVSGHRQFLPTATKMAGTNWQMMTLAKKKEKTPANKTSMQFFHFSPLFVLGQQRYKQLNAVEAFVPETAYSLTPHFITLQNEAL
jgi:hypothetical protein